MASRMPWAAECSPAEHRHNTHVFVNRAQGAVVMQVEGGEGVTLAASQTFYESPQDVHSVSRNASTTKFAKFFVFFIKETGFPLALLSKRAF